MLFSSVTFLFLFLPAVLGIYYLLLRDNRKLQNLFLFLSSIIFYAWGEPKFVFVMLLSILANWFIALKISRETSEKVKRRFIVAMLITNLSIIFLFKYSNFFLENVNRLGTVDITYQKILLPIGISFFTFQAISYVMDVYRGHGEAQKNPLNVGLYIAFFPQLIAGPIVRYETVSKQISGRKESFDKFDIGVKRFIIGLGKKMMIANPMALIADMAFDSDVQEISVILAVLGVIAYTLQIYYDFSGYSDMAIGLGKMFGFDFLENFNYPYIATSISEFWRRWHISLGTWFKDYLYIPLGGSRVKNKWLLYRNLFIVWMFTGIWHGANWTFIIWGMFYFVLLVFERMSGFEKRNIPISIKHIYTLAFVMFGWILFRSESISDVIDYLGVLFGQSGNPLIDNNTIMLFKENSVVIFVGILFAFPIMPYFKGMVQEHLLVRLIHKYHFVAYVVLFFLTCLYIIKNGYNPFIYFNF